MYLSSFSVSTFLLAVLLSFTAQDWRSIVPLTTTRSEVETLLGPAEPGYMAIYHLKEGNLSIEFSSGPCRADRQGGWNVPENTVVSVVFSPKEKQQLAELKLDRKKFRRVVDRHLGGVIYYINAQDGVVYEIQDGKVETIEYGPGKKYYSLKCDDSVKSLQRN
jgi:hypothetical protein